MSLAPGRRAARPRRVLGELDPNRDLNAPRGLTKRAPITFEQENEDAVLEGIRLGIYDQDEVIALTNQPIFTSAAPIDDAQGSDRQEPGIQSGNTSEAEVEAEDEDDEVEEEFGHLDDEFLGEEMDEDLGEEHDNDEQVEAEEQLQGPVFDPTAIGLKEINNLAHFGVSSHKPGNGVDELLSDDLDKYWQSDGQQPHLLTIHFLRRVEIRAIRFYVDYNQDESYTPTHIIFYAGTGHHDLIQFAEVPLINPVGWQDVPISECGGGPDGHSLCCWIVQMHVKENHQNGKDTHIRGIKIFALDEKSAGGAAADAVHEMEMNIDHAADRHAMQSLDPDEDQHYQDLLDSLGRNPSGTRYQPGDSNLSGFPDFMRETEIR
ncbi:anaphase-promoting complex, subunit 10-domain-containing protein [Podospora didyma]|uniref:Anaphase-promoting complex, subunit 10-domain-containing protein n=1 Tax=Podospora didyma TaxID=330526 RepID=A0AAE0NUX1_9PEZI|nr:anaphase-promoting complex, subunit 10-domain-containing protein [Podospora didyma]